MPEWLYEEGIGENRAALLHDGSILEAEIELPDMLRAGAVVAGRLARILVPGRRALVLLGPGGEALLEPLPRELTEGTALHVEITREAVPESGRPKLPKCRIGEGPEKAGPSLYERLRASGAGVTRVSHFDADRLEAAGWSELVEEGLSGEIAFPGGGLRMSVTPAMTLFDVDGALPPAELAVAGAAAAGRAIRRLRIGGSIGIDLPTLAAKDERQAAAAALDAALPQPFERTAVNGFGFMQVVRKRERPSIPELLHADPAGAAARLLLRKAERSPGPGERTLYAAPAVASRLEAHPDWLDLLARRLGASVRLNVDPELKLFAGHVHCRAA